MLMNKTTCCFLDDVVLVFFGTRARASVCVCVCVYVSVCGVCVCGMCVCMWCVYVCGVCVSEIRSLGRKVFQVC